MIYNNNLEWVLSPMDNNVVGLMVVNQHTGQSFHWNKNNISWNLIYKDHSLDLTMIFYIVHCDKFSEEKAEKTLYRVFTCLRKRQPLEVPFYSDSNDE